MKAVLILLGILVVLVVVWFTGLVVPGPFSSDPVYKPFTPDYQKLPALDIAKVKRVEMKDAQGSLTLQWEGDGWVLPDRAGFAAKKSQVETALGKLAGLDKASKAVFRSKEKKFHSVYDVVGDGKTRVTLKDDSKNVLLDLVIGKLADPVKDGNPRARSVFVREASRDEVFDVAEMTLAHAFMTRPQGWMDMRFFQMEPAAQQETINAVNEVVVEYVDEPETAGETTESQASQPTETAPVKRTRLRLVATEVEREEPEPPKADGSAQYPRPGGNEPPKEAATQPSDSQPSDTQPTSRKMIKVTEWKVVEPPEGAAVEVYEPHAKSLVQSLFVSSFDDIEGRGEIPEAGFASPRLTVEVRTKDGKSHRMVVGKLKPSPPEPAAEPGKPVRAQQKLLYCKVDDLPYTFLVNEWREKSFRKKPEDLKKPEAMANPDDPRMPNRAKPKIVIPDEKPETRK